jgi:uncharacterized protein
MAVNKLQTLATILAIATTGAALATPAAAQFSNGRSAVTEPLRAEPVQFRDFFQFPFLGGHGQSSPSNSYNPFYAPRPQQNFESNKAPPPRKVETQPTSTIMVIGDSFADWLGYGLEEAFSDTPEIGIVRKIKPYSGLIRYESARGDTQDWAQAVKDLLATEKPAAIVVMLGVNDRLALRERTPPPAAKGAAASASGQGAPPAQSPSDKAHPDAAHPDAGHSDATHPDAAHSDAAEPDGEQSPAGPNETQRRVPGGIYEFHTDQWNALYSKRIDEMIAALKSKGVPVLWVGLPAIRGTKSTSDMSYLDDLFRARAQKAGITYVDIWDGFVDEKGVFAVQGPDFEGQIRRLRSFDGVYFTKVGAEKLAHYVEHDLRRLITNPVVPVALPAPEEQSPAKGNARPTIGPVVPLTATGSENGDLLGAGGHATQHEADPIATRVLSHGEAIAAPPGRADDFSWPRAGANADANAKDATPAPAVPASAVPGSPSSDNNNADTGESNKNDAGKSETKKPGGARTEAAPGAASPRSGRPRAALDGAPPRPPLPINPAPSNAR